ncbi:hypothetical protein ACH4GZ_39125 [Streptomyces hygroscopicus]|uniref:hypothetical protein n=1 Tax=Streptomyces hygroscopicus TaxID=1912 RepID=UPI003787D58B
MTSTPAPEPTAASAPTRKLTGGQIAVLIAATIPMIGVGAGGAIGTYANASSVLHRSETALGVVAAGEGATLVAALVMIGVTMLGQAAPAVVRAALWLLPASASFMGLAIAPTPREAVVYALTPLAMTASAEGISFLARRIVAHTSGVDVEAQRRNAELMRRIAFHAAQAERHPEEKVREESALEAWKLMRRIGNGDAQLGSGLISVQRNRLTEGADTALLAMLTGTSEPTTALPVSRAIEPGELTTDPAGEPDGSTVMLTQRPEPGRESHTPALPEPQSIIQRAGQQVRREPVLSPAEPILTKTNQAAPETATCEPDEPDPGADEKEQQIATLAHRLTLGERLTKSSAAQLLGVSPATAGRRLKEARDRISDGTGMYL